MNQWHITLLLLIFAKIGLANNINIDSLIQQQISIADSLKSIGKPEDALAHLLKLRNNNSFSTSDCVTKANYYHKIGEYHYNLYNSKETLTYWQDSALQIRIKCLGPLHIETANSYFNVAIAYRELDNKRKESEHLLHSIKILESLPVIDTIRLSYRYLQVGILYDELGDFEQAENYLLYAQQYYKDIGLQWDKKVAELLMSLGTLKKHQQEYQETINYFHAAIETYENIKGKKNEEVIASCYLNLGTAYMYQKNYPLAEKNALISLKFYQGLSKNSNISTCYELLGNISKRQKKYSKALNHFQQSLQLRLKHSQASDIANAYENIGDLFVEQKQFDQALENYQTSITYLVPGIQGNSKKLELSVQYDLVIDKLDLLRVLSLKAETLLSRYKSIAQPEDLFDAYSIYQKLDTLLVKVRQNYKGSGSKFFLAQEALPIYEKAIEVSIHLYEKTNEPKYLDEAYIFCAKNKAIVLLDGLQDLNAKSIGIPEHLIEEEKKLRKEYSVLEGNIFSNINQEGQDSLLDANRSRLFDTRRQLEKLVNQLEKEYPNYYKLKYAFPNLSTIKTLQDSLSSEQTIIEYFVGSQQIFIFTILKNEIYYQAITKPTDFSDQCALFRKLSSGEMVFNEQQFRSSANAMFELLLKVPLSKLDQKVKRLIIIPDDLLLQLSFDNLLYQEAKAGESFPYLIKKYAIATAYSNQLLFQPQLLKNKDRPENLYAGFGLEYDDHTLEGLSLLSSFRNNSNENGEIGKLIYSDDEVQEIADFLKGTAWINEEATKSNFLKNAGQFRMLHFAMHGIIDEKEPLNSALIFFRESDSSDFVLRASELYPLELNTDLVVLSACHTGTGKIARGEGVRSLARAFAYAGSPALVTSLWSASDYSTKEILIPFYQYLKKGMPKDVALQQAKLDYLDNAPPSYKIPSYWSHLTIVGNTDTIVFPKQNRKWLFWVMGGIVLLLLFYFIANSLKPS